jgi:CheY-like chemotaxis protein
MSSKPIILVVEDNEIQRKVIKLLAAEYGFDVVLCAHCTEALDAYAVGGDIYSMILMDLRLPDIDGVTCAARIRQIKVPHGRRKVPMIAMTGYVAADDKAKCASMGFDDCLIKPFSSKEFRDIVLKWSRQTGVPTQEHTVIEWRPRRDANG